MARERQDLNLFYGNCDLDLGIFKRRKKIPTAFESRIRKEKRVVYACVQGGEGGRREKSRSETTTDGNGEVNRPRCYASVNEYIRKRFLSRSA